MVYFFVPNIIGYVRVVFGILAFWNYQNSGVFLACYFISYFLDCFDGWAARALNQATRFGQMLDMVTDRCCSAALFAVLTVMYPGAPAFGFCMLLALDLASHYCHVYSKLLSGETSHKKLSDDEPWILKIYYGSQLALFTLCLTNESFFVFLYMLAYAQIPGDFAASYHGLLTGLVYILAPFALMKQITNLLQVTFRLPFLENIFNVSIG
mmetsp:Transcript_61292/g.164636  ORF Transcript_61292/g.164636 Transcript_61292/m.164636 type:complete len:210 (-) Transcript_61292:136-765(-)